MHGDGPDDTRTGTDVHISSDDGTAYIAGAGSDCHPREYHDAMVNLDEPVEEDLSVREANAWTHYDRIADADLSRHHGEAMHD